MKTETFALTTWKVEISLRENDERHVTFFANENLAKDAVDQAYAAHLENLRKRNNVTEIKEENDPTSGNWKISELYGKKVTWWKRTSKGFIAMKDYFTAEKDVFKREVLG